MARKQLRPFAYLLLILAWLVVMSLPVLAFLIATRGEIRLGSNAMSNVRLFLVQESDAQGLGLEWSRPYGASANCARTTLRYLLWEGSEPGQSVEYCRCFDPASGSTLEAGPCDEF